MMMARFRGALWAPLALAAQFAAAGAQAQCRPGDYLVGEDEHYYYCATPLSALEVSDASRQLKELSEDGALLGDEWRFRKAAIDEAGCLARHSTAYVWGAKLTFPEECRAHRQLSVDCSGFVAHVERYAACFVEGFYQTVFDKLKGLHTNAAGQADYFRKHGAFVARGTARPGDVIFFERTDRKRKGITHVAIYLGTGRDGRALMIHASSSAGRVVFAKLPADLVAKIVGYGDVSALYRSVSRTSGSSGSAFPLGSFR